MPSGARMSSGEPRSGPPRRAGDLGARAAPAARAPEGVQSPPFPLCSSGEPVPLNGIPGAGSGLRTTYKGKSHSTASRLRGLVGLGRQIGPDIEAAAKILDPGLATPVAWLNTGISAFENLRQGIRPLPPMEVSLGVKDGYDAIVERRIAAYEQTGKQSKCPVDHRTAGLLYAYMGRYAAALEACRRVSAAGSDCLALFCVGYSLACLGRDREACRAYEASLLHAPSPDLALVASIALEASRADLRGLDGCAGGLGPFVMVLGNSQTCEACGLPAGDPGHIGLGYPGTQDRLCCAIREPIYLCCNCGLQAIRSFRRAKLALGGLCVAELVLTPTVPFLAPFVSISRLILEHWHVDSLRHGQAVAEHPGGQPVLRDAWGRWRNRIAGAARWNQSRRMRQRAHDDPGGKKALAQRRSPWLARLVGLRWCG